MYALARAGLRSAGWVTKVAAALLGMALAAVLSWSAARAADVYVDVGINGHFIEGGGLIVGDRTYVRLSDVADALGGRYIYDSDLNVAFVLTGNYLNLVADRLAEINPAVQAYTPISPIIAHLGILHGLPGPHLTVAYTPSGIVSSIVVAYTSDSVAYHAWFDQPAGPEFIPGMGLAYTQHIHVIDSELVELGGDTVVAFNGEALKLPADALVWVDGELYARLRDLAQASGGGVGWNVEARLATAKVVPGKELTFELLLALNEGLGGHYSVNEEFDHSGGHRVTPGGPAIEIDLDGAHRVIAFGANFPEASTPWFPWYDQTHGAAVEIFGFGRGYSQHIFVQERD